MVGHSIYGWTKAYYDRKFNFASYFSFGWTIFWFWPDIVWCPTVILRSVQDKTCYKSAIEEILNDHTRFSNLDIPTGKENNYITSLKKRVISGLRLIVVTFKWKSIHPYRFILFVEEICKQAPSSWPWFLCG